LRTWFDDSISIALDAAFFSGASWPNKFYDNILFKGKLKIEKWKFPWVWGLAKKP
jgi:hypothetical protein